LAGQVEAVGQEMDDVMIVGQAAGGRGQTEIAVLGQEHALRPETHFVVLLVVRHAVVEQHRQDVLVVFDFGPRGERLVAKISQTAGQKLSAPVKLMGELFGTVVQHRHDVGVVVLAVVVERVEEQPQADPFVRRAEHLAVVSPLTLGVPEG
jgi:hypothetical protein